MNQPAVSLILPTQGTRASLLTALRSARAQDFASFEIVVVDDSVDGADWTQRPGLATCLADPRVRVVPFNQGRGCAAAKNAGWRAARGDWLCYLDDDNEYFPGKIAAQHALAVVSGKPLVLCGLEVRIAGRRRIKQAAQDSYSGDGLLLDTLPDTNVLFHRRDLSARWDEELGTVDDACLFHAIVQERQLSSVPNVPQALVIYNAHGGERANRGFERLYRGERRLLVRWGHNYGANARRILLLRVLLSFCKFEPGRWGRLVARGWRLLRLSGLREWRVVANAVGLKLPFVRRWMVT